MRRTRSALLAGAALACALPIAGPALAHGFGQRYSLPIPLWLYLTGAGLTVGASFAIIALLVRRVPPAQDYKRIDLMRLPIGRVLGAPVVLLGLRLLGVGLYLLVVVAGLVGTQSPLKNIAPAMVWAIWWVGMAYVSALLVNEPLPASQTALVLLILAAVSFDGFRDTPAWAAIVDWLGHDFHHSAHILGLAAWVSLFLAVYLGFCRLIARYGESPSRAGGGPAVGHSVARIAGLFVLTLVPIAIAYHLAHYLFFLVMAAQYLIPLVSDPLGLGWDIFGTRNYFVRIGLIDARVVWYLSVAAIVAGHVTALYLAHLQALREFQDRRAALRSQWPMLALMVCYTMVSLWIIAQPIVNSG